MINHSGIGVYITHFTNFLISTNQYHIILIGETRLLLKKIQLQNNTRIIENDFPIYSIKEQFLMPFVIPMCDVFWSPHYNITVFPIRAKKTILTIPDIAHISMANFLGFNFVKKLYSNLVLYVGLQKADLITTISGFSKAEICNFHNVDKKIKVIHLGIDHYYFQPIKSDSLLSNVKSKYNLPEKYILFVGNVKPNKNLKTLVLAFEKLIETNPDIFLVIVGKKEGFITEDTGLFELISQNPILAQNIYFTGYVNTEDLPAIYQLAHIFAFPSLYEGFGFPPLEAMAMGTPVVASSVTSIPEICGDGVIYFDPNDPKDLLSKILKLLNDNSLIATMVKKGFVQTHGYTWEKSCQNFLEAIDRL